MKKIIVLLAAVLFCLQSPAFAEKVFKYSTDGVPIGLNPPQHGNRYSNVLITAIFDTLYEYKYLQQPFELKPNLADGMPTFSEDGLTLTIKIKKGVHFTDDPAFADGKGREVVAADFVYSMKRNFDPKSKPRGAWLWQGKIAGLDDWKKAGSDYSKEVEGLKALDRHTIQIQLTKPFPQIIYTFTMGYTAVAAQEVVEKYGEEVGLHPVGSGPYMLKDFNSQRAIIVKNPKYRKEVFDLEYEGYNEEKYGMTDIKSLGGKTLPIVDRVEVHFMKEQSARWNSFNKSDEIQFTTLLLEQTRNVIETKKPLVLKKEWADKYNYAQDTEAGFVYNNWNMENPEVGYNDDPVINEQNKALRCAMRKGFNWNERIRRFYQGFGTAYPGPIPPGIDGYDPNMSFDSVTYDPEGAKKMLKDAGWNARNLPVIEYNTTSNTRLKQFFEQWRGFMKKIGYPVKKLKLVTYATFGDFAEAVNTKKAMYYGMGWGLDYPDAENVLQLYYGPNGAPGSNGANYNNPKYNELYEKSSVMPPSPERSELYKEMNKILIDDCVMVGGFSRSKVKMWHKNVVMYPWEEVIGNYFKYVDVR